MLPLALALSLSVPLAGAATPVPWTPVLRDADLKSAQDTGRVLQNVEGYRRRGAYREAADEVRGWQERWAAGIDLRTAPREAARMKELLEQLVKLEELVQRADGDPRAAREFLAMVTTLAKPTGKSAEQARALRLMARHDAGLARMLDAAFPARVEITADGESPDPHLFTFPFENHLVELSREALPVARGSQAGASTLRVLMTIRENDRRNSILEHTAMRSYAVHLSATLVGADGAVLSQVATTRSSLGINPGFAARHNLDRIAAQLYEALIDDIAKRAAMGDLP